MGKKWKGWVCGDCKRRIPGDEVLPPVMPDDDRCMHAVVITFPCGAYARTVYCGPVRHYPREDA